jgi:hypothetical protein
MFVWRFLLKCWHVLDVEDELRQIREDEERENCWFPDFTAEELAIIIAEKTRKFPDVPQAVPAVEFEYPLPTQRRRRA